jgi:hypothetical protein
LLNIEARRNKQSTIEDFIEKAEGRIEVSPWSIKALVIEKITVK